MKPYWCNPSFSTPVFFGCPSFSSPANSSHQFAICAGNIKLTLSCSEYRLDIANSKEGKGSQSLLVG